jgi:hypothetical protein
LQERTVVQRNLQSRLEAAREARRRAAPVPESTTQDPDDGDDDGPVIDLRTLREMRQAAQRAQPAAEAAEEPIEPWSSSPRASMALLLQRQAALRGEPVPTTSPTEDGCPNCGGSVRIDLFDLVRSVAHLTCLDCGFLFTARSPHA